MEIKRNKAWRRFQENRVFKVRMLKFAGWQIVVWDENGNCIEHPQSQTDNAVHLLVEFAFS